MGGWMDRQMDRQRDGLTGSISVHAAPEVFFQSPDSESPHRKQPINKSALPILTVRRVIGTQGDFLSRSQAPTSHLTHRAVLGVHTGLQKFIQDSPCTRHLIRSPPVTSHTCHQGTCPETHSPGSPVVTSPRREHPSLLVPCLRL